MEKEKMQLAVTTWVLYGVGVCLIVVRMYGMSQTVGQYSGILTVASVSRLLTLRSLAKLQLDDWLMIIIVVRTDKLDMGETPYSPPQVPFTAMVATADGSDSFSTSTDAKRRLKMRFALEELQLTTNWLVKACLIILYRRIL